MNESYSKPYKYWFLPIITGIIFIISGIYIFRTPLSSYLALTMLFAAIFFISGIFEIINAISNRHFQNWGWALVGGIIDLLFGIILMASPMLTATFLPIYVGFIIMFRSITGIGHAIALKEMNISAWTTPLIFGILGILLSLLMIFNPYIGGLTIVYYTAFSIIMFGVLQIILGITLKKLKQL